jgi:fatty acyl-CoA reductase
MNADWTETRAGENDSPASTIAVFDLDGTLFSGHVWYGVVRYHRAQRINRFWLYVYLIVHFPLWYMQKLRLLSSERARYLWARDMSWTLKGMGEDQTSAMYTWIADEYIAPLLRTDVLVRLRDHQAKGHRLILLSGAFEGLLAAVGARLGVDEVLGTRLKRVDGRCTGASLPPIPQGDGKVQRLLAHLSESEKPIALSESFAYADSITDRPVLEAVGHPVAVYPDQALADLALGSGWSVIGEVQ